MAVARPKAKRSSKRTTVVPSATNLPEAAADDQNRRIRHYLISMGIRTVCFVAGVALWGVNRWAAGACFAAAAILPYVAVVFANATGQRKIDVMGSVVPEPTNRREIHAPDDRGRA